MAYKVREYKITGKAPIKKIQNRIIEKGKKIIKKIYGNIVREHIKESRTPILNTKDQGKTVE